MDRSTRPFPSGDVHDHLRWLVETLGREQVIWGSDYPNVSDRAIHEETTRWLDHVDSFSSNDLAWRDDRSFDCRRSLTDPSTDSSTRTARPAEMWRFGTI